MKINYVFLVLAVVLLCACEKYDEVLPAYIAQALETGRLQQTPYSKYRECRIAAEAYNTGGML